MSNILVDGKLSQSICNKIEKHLQPLAKELGFKIERGNATYEPCGTISLKLNIQHKDYEKNYFIEHCGTYDLKETNLDQDFLVGREKYTLKGIDPKRRAFPIIVFSHQKNKRFSLRRSVFDRAKWV